jgi:uncharacterized protein involved in exopolysaccharide biosynthesis
VSALRAPWHFDNLTRVSSEDVGRRQTDRASHNVAGAEYFFARALHIFFGKPVRFLLPAILLTALGAYMAMSKPDQYQSSGVLTVSSETFLGELSQVRTAETSFETPSTTVARQFNELMQTAAFAETVVEGAGLTTAPGPNQVDLAEIRASVYAISTGDSLLSIVATAEVPSRAQALAASGIDAYRSFVVSSEVAGSDVAESFYDEQLAVQKAQVDAATDALASYLAAHPEPIFESEERDVAEQFEIERLNAQLVRAQERYDEAFDNREQSSLATMQSTADSGQRFRVLDEPDSPVLPNSGLRATLTTTIMFGVLGLLVSFGALMIACLLDRSIHSARDLERLGVVVRSVVPMTKMSKTATPRHLAPVTAKTPEPMRSAV